MQFLNELNKEKQDIIKQEGNILVIANPGAGKTKLLVGKYLWLMIEKNIKPEDILCLTFTNKAKRELEERIIKSIKEEKLNIDLSKLNVHTFHSYALDSLDQEELVSTNLLRYTIFQFLKDKEILNYSDSYLLDVVVPKMENLISYLKSFGIAADNIDIKKVKKNLKEEDKVSKEEVDKFAQDFVEIYKHYESVKEQIGLDYADILLKFLKLNKIPKYQYVLVDELQDVNKIEAEIALKSGNIFIAVGDKKQAIFGFQGGSILNFDMFKDSKEFILTENFRSANTILDYAKTQFLSKTKELSHKKELEKLKSTIVGDAKVKICNTDRENIYASACELVKNLHEKGKKTAIIVRTNSQIGEVSKELRNRSIDHTSTFFSASNDTKKNIIKFLKGILSRDMNDIKNSMFTPYFPLDLQTAFSLSEKETLTLEEIYSNCPEFKKMRESVRTIEDVKSLFVENIIPISISYGKEYLLAAMSVRDAYTEALESLENINLKNVLDFLQSSDLLSNQSNVENEIIVTTVHKSKGREYDNVIYLPKQTRDTSNFQNRVVEAILETHGINATEELEEEALRIDFVAFTRAKKYLYVLTDKTEDYLDESSEINNISVESIDTFDLFEKGKRAYGMFLEGNFEKAKTLLENNDKWINDYVKNHFESLDRISFSSLQNSAYDYLINNILKLREFSYATTIGTEVHSMAEALTKGEEIKVREELIPYKNNILEILKEIKKIYSIVVEIEYRLNLPVSKMIKTNSELNFKGFIDLILKNKDGEHLILDWKTDKKTDNSYKHKQQLESYKRAYSEQHNIPLDKIKVAIGFIGLRPTVNMGKIDYELEQRQPAKTSFSTFTKKVEKVIEWKNNPNLFLEELKNNKQEDVIWKSVVEQYVKEMKQ